MKEFMKNFEKRHFLLVAGLLFTAGYIALILYIHTPKDHDSIFAFIAGAKANEVGDFLAGVFSPLAFLWLVIGYFMQSEELRLQRLELNEQRGELSETREVLDKTRDAMEAQAGFMREQTEIEGAKVRPYFSLRYKSTTAGSDIIGRRFSFEAINTATAAYDVRLYLNNELLQTHSHIMDSGGINFYIDSKEQPCVTWTITYQDARGKNLRQDLKYHNGETNSSIPLEIKP